jgi:hypothetical protein
MALVDLRRVAPPAVAFVVVGALVATLFVHRDAEPLPDPEAASAGDRREAIDLYATSGEDKRLTGESDPAIARLPEGHPPIRGGEDDPAAHGLPPGHPSPPDPRDPPTPTTGTTAALPFSFTAPAGWSQQAPQGKMRAAQWALAAEPGGEPGEIVIFHSIGGSVAANVERWEKEFGGVKAKTSQRKAGVVTVTRVDIAGTFSGGMAPRSAGASGKREGWRLLGAVVETPKGTYFVKGTGPGAVMAREETAFDEFLGSIR